MKSFIRTATACAALVATALALVRADEPSDVLTLTQDTFQSTIDATPVIMVEFYAPWCGHCKALAPEYEKAATELKDTGLALAKVDCTVEKEVCSEQGVSGYPTLKVFHSGKASPYEKARKADAIVEHMKKQLLPAVTTVDAATFEEFTASAKVVVMGFFAKPDSDAAEAFAATASKYRDDYIFGMTTDAALAKKAGAAVPGVVLFKKFDEKKNVFDGATVNAEDLENFIQTYSVPLVDDIGPINYSKYMDSGLPLAYAFVASDEDRELFGETLNALAKEYRGKVNFCYIDANSFGGHAKNLNLKESWPAFAIQNVKDGAKYPFDQSATITGEAITSFVSDFVAGNVAPSIKSQPIPEANDEPVKVVVADNFKDLVQDENKDVLIEFYAPWCGHCKKLVPIYDELAKKLESVPTLTIAKMDATENDVPPGLGFTIEGFPTIKLFKAGTNEVVDYDGTRDVSGFIKFLTKNVEHKFEVPEGAVEEPAEEEEEKEDAEATGEEGAEHDEL